MRYADVVASLGLTGICLDPGCGLDPYRQRGTLFLGVLHWRERRVTRRGLRQFLLLVARRDREADPGYLNERRFRWLYLYLDEMAANDLAGRLGVRFPVAFSRAERSRCLWYAGKARARITLAHPAAYSWAVRGIA